MTTYKKPLPIPLKVCKQEGHEFKTVIVCLRCGWVTDQPLDPTLNPGFLKKMEKADPL